MLIGFEDMVADMLNNNKPNSIVTGLLILASALRF